MIRTDISLREKYAQVLYELACESRSTDAAKDDLELLADITKSEKDFIRFMDSPYFTRSCKVEAVNKVLAGKISELTMNFLMVLIRHNRIRLLPEIIARYGQIWDENNGYLPVKVTVSRPLDKAETEELAASIGAAVGSIARLEVKVNPDIIGGAVIRYGDRVIDNTIRGRLQTALKTIMGTAKEQLVSA